MFETWDDARVEERLCEQGAQVAAGECTLVLLVAEWDRRGVWAGQGCRSAAHWLNWRLGTSLGAAREQVRVGRALGRLPWLRGAFAAGEVSYSKVRAVTRIATAANEELLVGWAKAATASQLETIVREHRRATGAAEADGAQAQHARRYLRSYTDDDGMVVIRARLAPEDGAVVLAAIEAARQGAGAGVGADAGAGGTGAVEVEDGGDVPAETSSVASGVPAETSSGAGGVTEETQDGAAGDPAPAAGGGVPAETSWGAEVCFDGPLDAFEISAADALVDLSRRSLEATGAGEAGPPPVTVLVHVDEAVLADADQPGCCHVEGVGAISAHAAARLACDAAVSRLTYQANGAVEAAGATRSIPRTMRRALLARDRHCRFPGCSTRRFLHAHHLRHWADGGPTALSNLISLCGAHHRFVHEGGWKLTAGASGALEARCPDGRQLGASPPALGAAGEDLATSHRRRGLDVDASSLAYSGERYDLDLALLVLSQIDEEAKEATAPVGR